MALDMPSRAASATVVTSDALRSLRSCGPVVGINGVSHTALTVVKTIRGGNETGDSCHALPYGWIDSCQDERAQSGPCRTEHREKPRSPIGAGSSSVSAKNTTGAPRRRSRHCALGWACRKRAGQPTYRSSSTRSRTRGRRRSSGSSSAADRRNGIRSPRRSSSPRISPSWSQPSTGKVRLSRPWYWNFGSWPLGSWN